MNLAYMTLDEAKALDNSSPVAQVTGLGSRLRRTVNRTSFFRDADEFYVAKHGSDSNYTGKSWEDPFLTIQKALNVARYIPGTTDIDYGKNRHKYIHVAPGQYNEQLLFSGYNIHLIADSPYPNNGDYGAIINYDNAITATCVIGFTGAGIEIAGFCFNSERAIPLMLMGSGTVADGCDIHHNFFKGDNSKTVTIGIDAEAKNSWIHHNRFSGIITGIDVDASAWFHGMEVFENTMGNVTNGILIANGATITESAIYRNRIVGSTASITNSQATDIIITENRTKPAISDAGGAAGDNTTLA